MTDLPEDELWLRIRNALDGYVRSTKPRERTTDGIVGLILGCFGDGLFQVCLGPASGASDPQVRSVAVRIDDRLNLYVARAAEYFAAVAGSHDASPAPMTAAGSA
jgi:hypothetical protein